MVDITFESNKAVIRFPKRMITVEYVQNFLRRLRAEDLIDKSELRDGEDFALSEEIKNNWWKENKDRYIQGISY